MKKITLLLFPIVAISFFCSFQKDLTATNKNGEVEKITSDSTFDAEKALASLREQIKGREKEPAEKVFKNIQSYKGVPAGRLLNIMKIAFNKSLGVTCTHCHNPDAWESEEKPAKQVARDMRKMLKTINNDLLANIANLQSETPRVNCTTCHRGQVKPGFDISKTKK